MCVNQVFDMPETAIDTVVEDAHRDPLFETVDWVPNNWWTMFDDPQLEEFICTAIERNPTLQAARENIYLAHYNADKVRSAIFPTLSWGGDVSRQKFSETGIIPFSNAANTTGQTTGFAPLAVMGGQNGIPVYFTQYETELLFNYDFDIWGKNRNMWLSALSEEQAALADAAFSRLMLSTSVAQVYLRLQTEYREREIVNALVKNKMDYLEYVQKRLKNNLESAITVNSAEVNLAQVRQLLQEVEANILVDEYQLKSYLAGDFDEEIINSSIAEKILPTVPLPEEIPMRLVSRRPDIAAQLWLIESAGKQIDVAKAGFYPDFNLFALFGYQTLHFKKLFQWRSSDYNVDPAFTLPIFEGGRLIANWRGSEVNYNLAISHYNELVLNAAKEVLEGITLLRNANYQLQELKNVTSSQTINFDLMAQRVSHNLNSRLDYLTSEELMLRAKLQEAQGLGNIYRSIVTLIKALGGGY